jgi:hypothetical protein
MSSIINTIISAFRFITGQESYDEISDNAKLVGIGMVVLLVWFALFITQDANPEIL